MLLVTFFWHTDGRIIYGPVILLSHHTLRGLHGLGKQTATGVLGGTAYCIYFI